MAQRTTTSGIAGVLTTRTGNTVAAGTTTAYLMGGMTGQGKNSVPRVRELPADRTHDIGFQSDDHPWLPNEKDAA